MVTKFKGLAWLSYNQQFRCRAVYNFCLKWDKVDLKLWTVTFAGIAKPHCNVCWSPYQAEDVCSSSDFNRSPQWPKTICFNFNKPSSWRMQLLTRMPMLPSHYTMPPQTAPSNSPTTPASPPNPMGAERNKWPEQLRCNQRPLVSSPIDILFYCLELELRNHPDRNFVKLMHLVSLRRALAFVV